MTATAQGAQGVLDRHNVLVHLGLLLSCRVLSGVRHHVAAQCAQGWTATVRWFFGQSWDLGAVTVTGTMLLCA